MARFASFLLPLALAAVPAHAGINFASTFKNLGYFQSGAGGASVVFAGAFFNASIQANPGDFDSATLVYPGTGSPATLPQTSPGNFGIGPGFPDKASMDAAYPFGDYVLTGDNSGAGTSQSATLHYTTDAYALNLPALSGASYDALQGLRPQGSAFTVGFNAQSPSPNSTVAYTYFTIFGVPGCGLASTATSCTINPSLLAPHTTYTYELDFSNRIETHSSFVAGVDFDVRTDGRFTTGGVPEASTWTLLLAGFATVGTAVRRRRNAAAALG